MEEEISTVIIECEMCWYVFPVIADDIEDIEFCPKCGKQHLRKGANYE